MFLDLNLFTFDEPTNYQSFEDKVNNHDYEIFSEDDLVCFDKWNVVACMKLFGEEESFIRIGGRIIRGN